MARGYNGTTHAHAAPDLTGLTDFSVAFWCVAASLSTADYRVAFSADSDGAPTEQCMFGVAQAGLDEYWYATTVDGTGGTIQSSGSSFGTGVWRSIVLTRTGTTARGYVGNVEIGSGTTVGSGSVDLRNVRVGCHFFSSANGQFANVHFGELAFWDAVLTSADRAALAAGVSPLFVRPGSLLRYYPMVRELGDVFGGTALTVASGAPDVVEHARVYYPVPPAALPFGGAAAGFDSAAFPYDEAVPPVRRRPMAVSY